MNQRYVLTTVKLKDLLSHKVQTQNLLFTFTWNVKRPQNNFVPIFNSKVGVRLIHECDLYSSKYGNHNCLTCAKAEILDLTVCIVVNGEKFQSHAVTLTLIGQCPMLNSSELFSYATIYSNFKLLD